ncbi:hypothetical protein BHU72_09775 [Desulfuribacillus stibiiarsenatis]|uniref:Uncharacterized protein n=1 Tax=Desulfuribacillus stibiiarsenatis TaxID=1390249 RepID=A0A1E5L2W1_9FIRM|nr:hypothetical protein [Desulfuribacillus stibiiarsenatis]OEH84485.1 hypothetical protein BHU72_09775 [Desulfuribacillus stibiiarsenatis]
MRVLKQRQLFILFIFTLLVATMVQPSMVAAEQTDFTVKEVFISIRPEYDQPVDWPNPEIPAVLVINQVDIINNTDEQLTTFSFPAPTNEPNFYVFATGKSGGPGQYFPAPHVLGDRVIHVDLREQPIPPKELYSLVVQYYYSPFALDGIRKSFSFEFAPPFTVEKVVSNVIVPPAGRNAKVEPAELALKEGNYTNVNADNPVNVAIEYDKADNVPTNKPLDKSGQAGGSDFDSKAVGYVAFIIILAIILFFVLKLGPTDNSKKQKNKTKQAKQQEPKKEVKVASKTQQDNKIVNQSPKKAAPVATEDQKELRRQLIAGEIDEQTYKDKLKKL